MENQASFAQAEYAGKKKPARRELFLLERESLVPWARLVALIVPFYPKGERGRPPGGVEKMLRMYFLPLWHALADEALEDAPYDSQAPRNFAGIGPGSEAVPDATALLKFRHLLEAQALTQAISGQINAMLAGRGILRREGAIVDATIIAAPSSTRNKARERDPGMHRAKKGSQWDFGMKAHIGVGLCSGVVHSLTGTAASGAGIAGAHPFLPGKGKDAFLDAGCPGVQKRAGIQARFPQVCWCVAAKRGKTKAVAGGKLKELTLAVEKSKARLRAHVEHPFPGLKNLFAHRKGRYRGPAKNTAQLHGLFALASLVIAKPYLQRVSAQ